MYQIPKQNIIGAAAIIKRGMALIFPSETSYGLGCDATNQAAVDKIYQIKNRPGNKSLLIVVPSIDEAKKYLVWNETIDKLSKNYWAKKNHPLTIVGKCLNKDLAQGVASEWGTVAVRVTHDPWLKDLCVRANAPLVATSANVSGAGDFYDANEAIKVFQNSQFAPEAVVDGGVLKNNLPSTIVDATDNQIKILRQGAFKIPNNTGQIFLPFVFLFATAALSLITVAYSWQMTVIDIDNTVLATSSYEKPWHAYGEKKYLKTVKGLYITAYSAGSEKKLDEIIRLVEQTELNAIVIDIKDYSGLVLYDSNLASVNSYKTEDNRLGDVAALVQKLHEHDIYAIARQTIFQDPVLAEAKPEWAIKKKSSGIWRDKKGLSWVDPTRKEVWDYNVSIAKEAAKFGFDEINFDYVRFPSDGNMSEVVYTVGDKKKCEVMNEFYKYLSAHLADEPIWISFDMFGLVMETASSSDMNIGQRLADAVENADYICPMMYPSHYPSGHLNLKNPADYPAEVIENGMQKGLPKFANQRAKVRPWIQAFDLGAIYDAAKIRAQIDMVEKYTDAGWLLWNASNRYTDAGLDK